MKTSKLALFNTVKGQYSQKSFQPSLELPQVTAKEKIDALNERNERKAQFKARKRLKSKTLGVVSKFVAEDGFQMEIPNDILVLFPNGDDKPLTKAQLRSRRRAEVKYQRGQ